MIGDFIKALGRSITALVIGFGCSHAHAALQVYTDRAAWQLAAGGLPGLAQDFDAFGTDSVYNPGPIAAGFLSFEVVGGGSDTSWRIDAAPFNFSNIPPVNGTTFVTVLGPDPRFFGHTRIGFAAVRALGFDYSGASYSTADGVLTTSRGDEVALSELDHGITAFVGLLYDAGETFTSLDVEPGPFKAGHNFNDFAMGLDNVAAYRPVPIPAGIWLFGPVICGLALSGRRKGGMTRPCAGRARSRPAESRRPPLVHGASPRSAAV